MPRQSDRMNFTKRDKELKRLEKRQKKAAKKAGKK
jgi:hypothetical protein